MLICAQHHVAECTWILEGTHPIEKLYCARFLVSKVIRVKQNQTRMHSSRMRTARSLTVSRISLYPMHAPPEQPCTPPKQPCMPPRATMHTPPGSNHACPPCDQPHMPPREQPHMLPRSNHACPLGSNHACPLGATTHALPPKSNHTHPPGATIHAPPWTECGHTLLKILPCPNFVAGGKYSVGNGPKGTLPICTKIFSNHGQLFESLSLNHRGF